MDSTSDLLRETATRLFQEHCEAPRLRAAETEWPQAAWDAVEEAGLTKALIPETAGGYGVAVADALSLLRVAGEHALPIPLAETLLASWLLAGAGLPVPDGPLTIAPVAGGETLALNRKDGIWRLQGRATRVPWARNAAAAAVLAQHDGRSHVALLSAEMLSVEGGEGENLAREPRDTLTLDVVPEAVAPAAAGVGVTQLRAIGAAMRSLQIAGALSHVTAISVQYAQDRVQFGRPIGKFQAVQQNLAVMAGQTAAASAAADLAAEAVADGIRLLPIAAAKSRTGEAAGQAAAIAHQVHGAIGFTYEHELHFFTKRLWSWRDEFGNEAEWNLYVGRHMAKAGADRLWAEITAA
jgi:alkylation response protein AidB-like acyl-CoA dehydrogenase